MATRPRRTTTLAGPNRFAIGAATGGLVVLASAGTALLVLTGTSAVTPPVAAPPPLPSSAPLATAPGVVVLPSLPGSTTAVATGHGSTRRILTSGARRTPAALLTVFAPPAAAPAALLTVFAPPAVAPAAASAAALPAALAFTDPVPAGDSAPTASVVAAPAPTRAQLRAQREAARAAAKRASRGDHVAGLLSSLTPVAATDVSAAVVRTAAILRSEHGSAETTKRPATADATPGSQAKRLAKPTEVVAQSANRHANRKHAKKPPKPKHAKHAKHVKHDRD